MAAVPTDPYELMHWNMKLAHSTYKVGYDTILPLLDNPPTNDLKNFLGYLEAWAQSIVHHHDTEEESVFPFLNRKMDFSHEHEQHEAVHAFLSDFLAVVRAAKADAATFDAAQLKAKMLGSHDAIFTHFNEEVEHLEADKLRAAGMTEAECLEMIAAMEKKAKGTGDPFLVVPYMRSHTPPEYKDIWPPMPWVLRKVAVPYLLAKRYSGYWKWAPYAMS